MMTSTKVSLWAAGIWLALNLVVSALAPSEREFMNMGFSEARSAIEGLSVIQGIANISLIAALISIVVTGFKKIIGKHTPHITHVAGHAISASGGATVATDSARIDQSVNVSNSSFQLSPDHYAAIATILRHIKASGLPSVTKNHAALLEEKIATDGGRKNLEPEKTKSYLKDLVSLAESAKPIAEITVKAIELLTKVI